MRARRSKIVVDLFCGAGGLSAGANDALVALGYRPQFHAVNHWDLATQTYAANHPGARVHCVSLDAASPSQIIPGGHVDLLLAGIECTYFSRARGGKPVTDQQRSSAWHVLHWCTELHVEHVILENVPEFLKWGPVSRRTGRPIKSREGEYFRAFERAMNAVGMNIRYEVVNCADYGDPTTRQRLLIIGWRSARRPPWPRMTHGRSSSREEQGPREPWRTARDHVIDWSIPGRSIFDRDRPLAPKTLARIAAGIIKFGWPAPFLVVLRQHADARGIDLPLPTVTAGGTHIGLVQPFVLSQASGGAPRDTGEPLCTVPCGGAHALIVPYYGSGSGLTCGSVDRPLPTATAKARFGLVMPVTHSDRSNRARSLDDPVPTLTTAKRGELAVIEAIDVRDGVGNQYKRRSHDILFRMLQPHELAAAMSLSTPEHPYHFIGNKTQVVRQIGQAVPRRTARAFALTLMERGV